MASELQIKVNGLIARRARLRVFVLALLVVLSLAVGPLAQAATFVVSTTSDAVDVAPGNGVCADALGACSLRAAIQEANALAGVDRIELSAGVYVLSLAGRGEDLAATGDLDVRSPLALVGAGAGVTVIDANEIDRVLDVHPGSGSVRVEGVTVRRGSSASPPFPGHVGGGILNSAALTIVDSAVVSNRAPDLSGAGGGVYNAATGVLVIDDSEIASNSANDIGGGLANLGSAEVTASTVRGNGARHIGGGIYNGGSLRIRLSTIESNSISTVNGGGIYHGAGTLEILDSSVINNSSPSEGGGLVSRAAGSIVGTTFAGNVAGQGGPSTGGGGGAIYHTAGPLTLVNSTLSGNRTYGTGGGIWATGGSVALVFSTIVGNGVVEVTPGFFPAGGGVRLDATASGSLQGTLLADNVSASGTPGAAVAANCTGSSRPTSLGYNLEDAATCALSGAGDLSNVEPLLGPLADNGGPTLTHALLPSSPAIDAGDNAGCPSTDQRGVARPQGMRCDIGAFEKVVERSCLTAPRSGPLTVTAGQSVCLGAGAIIAGPITVQSGGSLEIEGGAIVAGPITVQSGGSLEIEGGATVTGPITSTGATAFRLCGSSVTGPLTVTGTTGLVLIGGDADTGPCAGNQLTGPTTLTGNTGGVEFNANRVTGALTISGNTGTVHVTDNTITGPSTIQ